jgi:hypothetical protein
MVIADEVRHKKRLKCSLKEFIRRIGKINCSQCQPIGTATVMKVSTYLSGLFSNNVTRKFKMTKTLAILFAGLFATATAFAQAPAAPAAAAPAAKKEETKPAAKKEEAKKPAAKKEEAKPAAKKEEAKK